jgi:hypothetical protein
VNEDYAVAALQMRELQSIGILTNHSVVPITIRFDNRFIFVITATGSESNQDEG